MRRPVLQVLQVPAQQALRQVPLARPGHPVAVRLARQVLPPVRPVAVRLGPLSHSLPPSKP
jgi:hypothetical protein